MSYFISRVIHDQTKLGRGFTSNIYLAHRLSIQLSILWNAVLNLEHMNAV